MLLWAVVLLELLSPVPALLTIGALYVLLARPAWFPALVRELYNPRP
jgi:hypothetical protein